jgi:hypothetical protein
VIAHSDRATSRPIYALAMSERPVKRQALELLGALVLGGVVLFGGVGLMGYGFTRAANETIGDSHLIKSQRAAIDRSGCDHLRSLFPEYRSNIDSTHSAVEGVEAIVKRSEKLHCDPPLRVPWPVRPN